MDSMKIQTNYMLGTIEAIIQKIIRKKLGYNVILDFDKPIEASFDETGLNLNLAISVNVPKDDISKIIKDLV